MPGVVIEQITGKRRRIALRGRSMPFRPFSIVRLQKVAVSWTPANPKANDQTIGPRFEPTTFKGKWSDKYLFADDSAPALHNFPKLSPALAGVPGVASSTVWLGTNPFPATQQARLARVVVDAFALLTNEGQEIRFTWDQVVMYGKITRFVPFYGESGSGGIQDIGWEMEITWSGETEKPPIIKKVSLNILAMAQLLAMLLSALNDVLDKLGLLALPNAFVNMVVGPVAALAGLVAGVIMLLRKLVSITSIPSDIAAGIGAQLQAIKLLAAQLRQDIDDLSPAAAEASKAGKVDASQIAALVQASLRDRLVEIAAFCAEQQRVLDLFAGDEILATFYADSATSLRDVATRYYGSPDEWLRISNFNAFFSSTVATGTIVRVPRIG